MFNFRKRSLLLMIFIQFLLMESFAIASNKDAENHRKFLPHYRVEALNILFTAYNNQRASPLAKRIYSVLWNYLNSPVLNYLPPDREYNFCATRPNVTAFYDPQSKGIYICSQYLNADDGVSVRAYNPLHLIETIIHEASHATGMDHEIDEKDDECGATLISVSAFNHARRDAKPILKLNGYIAEGRCRIKSADVISEVKR